MARAARIGVHNVRGDQNGDSERNGKLERRKRDSYKGQSIKWLPTASVWGDPRFAPKIQVDRDRLVETFSRVLVSFSTRSNPKRNIKREMGNPSAEIQGGEVQALRTCLVRLASS